MPSGSRRDDHRDGSPSANSAIRLLGCENDMESAKAVVDSVLALKRVTLVRDPQDLEARDKHRRELNGGFDESGGP